VSAVQIVIENPALSFARSLCTIDALSAWEGRGWVAVGACTDPSRDPIRTDTEQAEHDQAEAERIAALLKSDAAPATSRPRK
jgi:hypothetical protein